MFFDAQRPVGHTRTLSGTPADDVSGARSMPGQPRAGAMHEQ
jgi:hypothetical protein